MQTGFILEGNPGSAGNVVGVSPGDPEEDGGPLVQVNTTLTPYMGTLFPQGTVHFQFNPECEPAVFAAAFDNNDPGRTQIARSFFSVRPDFVVGAALGETIDAEDLEVVRGHIPSAFAELIEGCVARCRL